MFDIGLNFLKTCFLRLTFFRPQHDSKKEARAGCPTGVASNGVREPTNFTIISKTFE